MITLKAQFSWHDKQAIILQLEHIGQLISQGYTSGDGWSIEGNEQAELPVIEVEDDGEILSDDDIEY